MSSEGFEPIQAPVRTPDSFAPLTPEQRDVIIAAFAGIGVSR